MTDTFGRDREVAAIRRALAETAAGAGGCLILDGPPGIGKSHLLRTAAAFADSLGIAVAHREAFKLDLAAPLVTLAGALRDCGPATGEFEWLSGRPHHEDQYQTLERLRASLEKVAARQRDAPMTTPAPALPSVASSLRRPGSGKSMIASVLRTPVLVVGAGVAGSVLALELAHHGVPSIVVERASRPQRYSDLSLLTGRSMELLRRFGLARQMRRRGIDPDCTAGVVWSRRLDQPPVLVSEVPSVNQLRRTYATITDGSTPVEPYLLLPGTELSNGLRDAVRSHPLIDLRDGWTFTDLRLEQDGTVATVLEADAGVRHIIEASYLAGCDGAQSTVRRCLGVPMEQFGPPESYYTVSFRSTDLVRRSNHPVVYIAEGLTLTPGNDPDLWIGHLPMGPGEQTVIDAAKLLHERLGVGTEAPEVLGVVQWDDALGVAAAYRRGAAYLAGESAHRFAPHGGNVDTCIGDAVDLGWKLAATINGWGGPTLLSSYADERRRRALLDRELLARTRETRRRFRRLAAAGASNEFLADVLRQEPPQMDTSGTGLADGQASSSVVWQDPRGPHGGHSPPVTALGGRPPAMRLSGGDELFDRFGPQFTLVDLTDDATGTPLVASAKARGIPMTHLAVTDAAVRAGWASGLVLVRPDQHIAWRTDDTRSDWDVVLDVVTGRKSQDHVNT